MRLFFSAHGMDGAHKRQQRTADLVVGDKDEAGAKRRRVQNGGSFGQERTGNAVADSGCNNLYNSCRGTKGGGEGHASGLGVGAGIVGAIAVGGTLVGQLVGGRRSTAFGSTSTPRTCTCCRTCRRCRALASVCVSRSEASRKAVCATMWPRGETICGRPSTRRLRSSNHTPE